MHMNSPEVLHNLEQESSHDHAAGDTSSVRITQSQVDAVLRERVAGLQRLQTIVETRTYERLAQKVLTEKELLEAYVQNDQQTAKRVTQRAKDLDHQYFIKKPLNYSPL